MKRKKEEANETNSKLLLVGRKHFIERGYAEATLEEIVSEAQLTRGALYHHFGNKKGLFTAVLETIQTEIGHRVESEASLSNDPWDQLIMGCRAFVTSAVEPQNRRILLIDGPSVLGWEVWRKMDEENSMQHLREQLQIMQQQGQLKPVPIEAMTHFLSGALNESALWIAQSSDDQSLEDTMTVITHFLQGFKVHH
ncbi:TetR/AcrR family transcriptional regulator [Neobacillus mesonae]|nr:TetR/AcrR family transcriptional regulator [Neobacillus mesonae]